MTVASDYVEAFRHLAKTNNTIILPSNTGDISNAVVQVSLGCLNVMSYLTYLCFLKAMSIYKQLSPANTNTPSTDISSGIPDLSEYYSDDDERAQAEAKIMSDKSSNSNLKKH